MRMSGAKKTAGKSIDDEKVQRLIELDFWDIGA